ncbi:MAG: PilZ domain-containing protein [Planctomycetota bacterium]|nr:PilZ domain-containing protein [Planctomycetota bacterium]
MDEPRTNAIADSRRDPRVPIGDEVTIVFDVDRIVGPGKNVSAQGLYFTTEAALRVKVNIAGRDTTLSGELVRVDSMGHGQVGIAVRFLPEDDSGASDDDNSRG